MEEHCQLLLDHDQNMEPLVQCPLQHAKDSGHKFYFMVEPDHLIYTFTPVRAAATVCFTQRPPHWNASSAAFLSCPVAALLGHNATEAMVVHLPDFGGVAASLLGYDDNIFAIEAMEKKISSFFSMWVAENIAERAANIMRRFVNDSPGSVHTDTLALPLTLRGCLYEFA